MAALISRDTRRHLKQPRQPTLLGAELTSVKEEAFVLMVMDGLAIAAAYVKAGFNSKASNAPLILFHKPHIQARANAILEARRTQGVVTLPEVTSMLKRVFAGALHDAEYSAAHNAAFSLARIYGHVTDRATLEVIRRPSRDPDAPSEQALSAWVEALPALAGPGLEGPIEASFLRVSDAPAGPLGPDDHFPNDIKGPGPERYQPTAGPGPQGPELCNDIKGLGLAGTGVPGRSENGAPSGPVTGTPYECGPSPLLGPGPPEQKGAPGKEDEGTRIPSAEELFG